MRVSLAGTSTRYPRKGSDTRTGLPGNLPHSGITCGIIGPVTLMLPIRITAASITIAGLGFGGLEASGARCSCACSANAAAQRTKGAIQQCRMTVS